MRPGRRRSPGGAYVSTRETREFAARQEENEVDKVYSAGLTVRTRLRHPRMSLYLSEMSIPSSPPSLCPAAPSLASQRLQRSPSLLPSGIISASSHIYSIKYSSCRSYHSSPLSLLNAQLSPSAVRVECWLRGRIDVVSHTSTHPSPLSFSPHPPCSPNTTGVFLSALVCQRWSSLRSIRLPQGSVLHLLGLLRRCCCRVRTV